MINHNLTFAAFKHPKETHPLKQTLSKKNQIALTSFKAINQHKDKHVGGLRKFDNQENTLSNIQGSAYVRKNMVKVDKSTKKGPNRTFKSPVQKHWENVAESATQVIHPKLNFKGNLHSKCPLVISTARTQSVQLPTVMTPSLSKNNHSNHDDHFNASFFTQKHSLMSDHGSISSNKNSFNDSFQLHANNVSMDQEMNLTENVNSSMELQRDILGSVNEFPVDTGLKNMKKSHYFFNTGESVLKDLDTQSNASVTSSIPSVKFSEKYKHHKKRPTMPLYKPHHPPVAQKEGFCLEDFALLREIGSGKYGKVHVARHLKTGFTCALKQVSKKIIKEEKLQIPFIRQIKIQLFLNHPNIVQLYGIFHTKQNVYLIMQYCSGNHLLKYIKQNRQFSQMEIKVILSHVFQAVSYIHCNGVIHRDIKPQNIVIEHGTYKLCDFGWAAYSCGDARTTFCGTPLYVCPEVLKGEEYNEKADIWGLGIVTYELTFGRVPFSILNQNDLMKIVKDPVYFPIRSQTSQRLVYFIRKMLSKEASERPSLNEILSSELFSNLNITPTTPNNSEKELSLLF